jgi:transcriptional regulator with XRE-family HTH domain
MSGLGETVRLRRVELGMSQAALADACGVGQQTVSRWEQGTGIPHPSRLARLAEALELEPEYLHRVAGLLPIAEPAPMSRTFRELYDRLAELSDEQLWQLCDRLWRELRSRFTANGAGRSEGSIRARGRPGRGRA